MSTQQGAGDGRPECPGRQTALRCAAAGQRLHRQQWRRGRGGCSSGAAAAAATAAAPPARSPAQQRQQHPLPARLHKALLVVQPRLHQHLCNDVQQVPRLGRHCLAADLRSKALKRQVSTPDAGWSHRSRALAATALPRTAEGGWHKGSLVRSVGGDGGEQQAFHSAARQRSAAQRSAAQPSAVQCNRAPTIM